MADANPWVWDSLYGGEGGDELVQSGWRQRDAINGLYGPMQQDDPYAGQYYTGQINNKVNPAGTISGISDVAYGQNAQGEWEPLYQAGPNQGNALLQSQLGGQHEAYMPYGTQPAKSSWFDETGIALLAGGALGAAALGAGAGAGGAAAAEGAGAAGGGAGGFADLVAPVASTAPGSVAAPAAGSFGELVGPTSTSIATGSTGVAAAGGLAAAGAGGGGDGGELVGDPALEASGVGGDAAAPADVAALGAVPAFGGDAALEASGVDGLSGFGPTGADIPMVPDTGIGGGGGGVPGGDTTFGEVLDTEPPYQPYTDDLTPVPNGAPPAAPGGAAAPGGGGLQGAFDKALKYAPLAGLGMSAYNLLKKPPNAAGKIGEVGATQRGVGENLIAQAQSGKLNPSDSYAIDQWKAQALAAAKQYYAKAGLSDSSMATKAMSDIEAQAAAYRAKAIQDMLTQGVSILNGLNSVQIAGINAETQASKDAAAQSSNFMNALGQYGAWLKTQPKTGGAVANPT